MRIYKEFQVEAAHFLPNVSKTHKCHRLHGHSYRIEIHVEGKVDSSTGWVMDFADIGKVFQPVFDQIDHRYLNEIDGLENPTSENLARWIWLRIKPDLPGLAAVCIRETRTSGVSYEGD